ncbi:MAG: RNA-dependent DNA polymerase [Cyanothece sp. SIO1E1]|nr:RNA-dependent DNA polymerase [Cyanothece sp. SIO1E1]
MKHQLQSEFWAVLPWKRFRQNLFRLQKRVWKAVREGDKAKAKNLQKLILRSRSAQFLAIRQVTQLNRGKKTAGIDGKKSLTHRQRFELSRELATHVFTWQHQALREIPIPKKDGTKRLLKVPTMADRAWQCLALSAIEPAHEATFHAQSYGFRPGRSAWDAQKMLFLKLKSTSKGLDKTILEVDIEKCFDRIEHDALLRLVIAPKPLKMGLRQCLKAGASVEFPTQGTPQGGVVSPVLANIALHGVEHIGAYGTPSHRTFPCIRYADDMVFVLRPDQKATDILAQLQAFLATRGLNIKSSKTRIGAATDGFDFLGWHFYVQRNGKFRCVPSVDNFKTFRRKAKTIINSSNYNAQVKAQKLAPLVRGWRNYHRYCRMNGSRFSLWHMAYKTFQVFNREPKQNRYTARTLVNLAFPQVGYQESRYINVAGDRSPFDDDVLYWSKRNSALYDGPTAKTLKKQQHTCGHCSLAFVDGETVHLHHIDRNHHNWRSSNLLAVHESCHDLIHMRKAFA